MNSRSPVSATVRPPEDVGGVRGYEEFVQVMADPDHPENEDVREWFGGEYDTSSI